MKVLKILILLCFVQFIAFSQELKESKGKEFYVSFPPNFHNNQSSSNDAVRKSDSLAIFISAEKATKGTLTITDLLSNVKTINFEITDPSKIYEIKESFWDYELLPYNYSGDMNRFRSGPLSNIDNCEIVTNASWHLVCDEPVTVAALSQALMTSDATLLYPVNSYGRNYMIMAYNANSNVAPGQETPSQFVIVASEDGTEIEISPSAPTQKNNLNLQKVNLNKGEVYLVQSRVTSSYDLTGTKVSSNKTIAVFASQMRAQIPEGGDGISRDFLFEQLLPVEAWGTSGISVPFIQLNQPNPTGTDLTRILAYYNNTAIKVNGVFIKNINSGEFIEINGEEVAMIEADKSICIAQFKKSQQSTNDNNTIADPFMLMVPPTQQYLKKYKIVSPDAYEVFQTAPIQKRRVFIEHYITVVMPEEGLNTLRIDGQSINPNYIEIPNTKYHYANIQVQQGTNIVDADFPFGIYSYGYGYANSYGYVGGLGLEVIDKGDDNAPCTNEAFNLPDFLSASPYHLINDARIYKETLQLTRPLGYKAGAIWTDKAYLSAYGFKTGFSFSMINGQDNSIPDGGILGADGYALILQSNSNKAIGEAGGGIAYKGIENALVLEIDLYHNEDNLFNDPNGNHIALFASKGAVLADHKSKQLLAQVNDIEAIKNDGSRYYINLRYDALNKKLSADFGSDTNNLKVIFTLLDFDLNEYINLNANRAFVGISSATGSAWQRHLVHSWYYCGNEFLTGVETSQESENKVYPNPSSEMIFINAKELNGAKFQILDLLGNIAVEGLLENNSINISELAKGTYILKIQNSNKIFTKQIIKY